MSEEKPKQDDPCDDVGKNLSDWYKKPVDK